MKRLNPKTGAPFARGDTRDEDDLVFFQYTPYKDKYYETWYTKDKLKQAVKKKSDGRREYERKNPHKHRARIAKNRADNLKRKPRWIKDVFEKEIKEMYQMATELEKVFPWKMHIDHRIPKQGKLVSGLHVPWNLEILPWFENIKKGNKYVDESSAPSLPEGTYRKGKVYTQFGTVLAPGVGENNNDANNHSGADEGQDTDHCPQTGSGDSVVSGSTEVVTLEPLTSSKDYGDAEPEIVRLYFGS